MILRRLACRVPVVASWRSPPTFLFVPIRRCADLAAPASAAPTLRGRESPFMHAKKPEDVFELFQKTQATKPASTPVNIGFLISGFSTLVKMVDVKDGRMVAKDPRFGQMMDQMAAEVKVLNPGTLAVMSKCISKFQVKNKKLWDVILQQAKEKYTNLSPADVSAIVHTWGVMREGDTEAINMLCEQTLRRAPDFAPGHWVQFLSGFAKMGMVPSSALINAICDSLKTKNDSLKAIDICTLMHHFAALGLFNDELMEMCAFEANLAKHAETLTAIDLNMLMWAYAVNQTQPSEEARRIMLARILHLKDTFEPRNFGVIFWWLADARVNPNNKTLRPLAYRLRELIQKSPQDFTPRCIGQILYGMAQLKFIDKEKIRALSELLFMQFKSRDVLFHIIPRDWAFFFFSYATLDPYGMPNLKKALLVNALPHAAKMDQRGMLIMTHAVSMNFFARLPSKELTVLFEALAKELKTREKTFDPTDWELILENLGKFEQVTKYTATDPWWRAPHASTVEPAPSVTTPTPAAAV